METKMQVNKIILSLLFFGNIFSSDGKYVVKAEEESPISEKLKEVGLYTDLIKIILGYKSDFNVELPHAGTSRFVISGNGEYIIYRPLWTTDLSNKKVKDKIILYNFIKKTERQFTFNESSLTEAISDNGDRFIRKKDFLSGRFEYSKFMIDDHDKIKKDKDYLSVNESLYAYLGEELYTINKANSNLFGFRDNHLIHIQNVDKIFWFNSLLIDKLGKAAILYYRNNTKQNIIDFYDIQQNCSDKVNLNEIITSENGDSIALSENNKYLAYFNGDSYNAKLCVFDRVESTYFIEELKPTSRNIRTVFFLGNILFLICVCIDNSKKGNSEFYDQPTKIVEFAPSFLYKQYSIYEENKPALKQELEKYINGAADFNAVEAIIQYLGSSWVYKNNKYS